MESTPLKEEDFTQTWFNSVLTQFGTVKEIKISKPEVTGAMSNVRRVTFEQNQKTHSIILKFHSNSTSPEFMMVTGNLYQRELKCYQELTKFDSIKPLFPEIYYSTMSDDYQHFVILMEDAKTRGGRVISQETEIPKENEIDSVLKQISRFHSTFWHENTEAIDGGLQGSNDLWMKEKNLEWIPSIFFFNFHTKFSNEFKKENWGIYSKENVEKMVNEFVSGWSSLKMFLSNLQKTDNASNLILKMKELEKTISIEDSFRKFIKKCSEEYPLTLIHKDLRLNKYSHSNFILIAFSCFMKNLQNLLIGNACL
jgi:hypothetical protein